MKTLKITNPINKTVLILSIFIAISSLQCNREKLLYQSWILEQYGPEGTLVNVTFPSSGDTPVKKEIKLNLAENGKFSGNDGCNSLMGNFTSGKGRKIQFSHITSTLMMCRQEVMSQSRAMMSIFKNVSKYKVTDTSLLLLTENKEMLKYRKAQ
jgi:heat shock protein HslJ